MGGHPANIVMLTADAFGVLPPISRLTPEQAMYHFLSGYTARLAGTERGLGSEPEATFSTCFGAPFLPRHPTVYAKLLGEKIARHGATCWLVNTGWSGGAFGVGERMKIAHTRAMVRAAVEGKLASVAVAPDPNFGVLVPENVPDVPERGAEPAQHLVGQGRLRLDRARPRATLRGQFRAVRERGRRQGEGGGDPGGGVGGTACIGFTQHDQPAVTI